MTNGVFALCESMEGEVSGFLESEDWAIERKFDGDRVHIEAHAGNVRIFNRRGESYTNRLPEIVEEFKRIDVVLDGEICYFRDGRDDFTMVGRRCSTDDRFKVSLLSKKYPVIFVVFDILEFNGVSCIDLTYRERRTLLLEVVKPSERVMIAESYMDTASKRTAWDRSQLEGWEGVILKRVDCVYPAGRTANFLKVKHFKEELMTFTAYELNPAGITLTKPIRVACNGHQHKRVKAKIDQDGQAIILVQYLGDTKNGLKRQPTCRGMVE